MLNNGTLFENGLDLLPDIISADANADLTGDWWNTENFDRLYLVLMKPAGVAGDDLSIKLSQAQDNAGTGAKALNFSKLWHKIGTMNAVPQFTKVELATPTDDLDLASVNGADLGSDTVAACIVVEVRARSLDVNNGFKFVRVFFDGTDIATASTFITAFWLGSGNAYPQPIPLGAQA